MFIASTLLNLLLFIGLICFKTKVKVFLVKRYWLYVTLTVVIVGVFITPILLMWRNTVVLTWAITSLETAIDLIILKTSEVYPKHLRVRGFFLDFAGIPKLYFSEVVSRCYSVYNCYLAEKSHTFGLLMFVGTFSVFLFVY